MDAEFKDVKTPMAVNASAMEEIKKAISTPQPPPPPPQSGSEVLPVLRSTGGLSSGMSFAEAVAFHVGQQLVPNSDVTTPTFNRKTNPTKFFCNLHDRAKVSKMFFFCSSFGF